MDVRMGHDLSLDAHVGEGSDLTFGDNLLYEGEDQEMALIKKEEMSLVQRNIAGALAKLNEKESFIVTHRLMTDNPMTLQEIGDRYNFTRERARQIEIQAIKKLRLAIPYEVESKNLPAMIDAD